VSQAYLHADGQVDPGAEGGADGPGGQTQVLEELGEGLCEHQARPLLRDHHAAPHARQVHAPRLQHKQRIKGLFNGAEPCCDLHIITVCVCVCVCTVFVCIFSSRWKKI